MPTKIERLEARRGRMIDRILRLHDQAEATNAKIYGLSCRIERMNREIDAARAQEERRKAVAGVGSAPGAPPCADRPSRQAG